MEEETDNNNLYFFFFYNNNFKTGHDVLVQGCAKCCGNISDGVAGGFGGQRHKGTRREQGLRGAPGHGDEAGWTDSGCAFTNKPLTERTK